MYVYIYVYPGKLCESISVTCGPVASAAEVIALAEALRTNQTLQQLSVPWSDLQAPCAPGKSTMWGFHDFEHRKILSVWHHISQ
jgi:hypothetical protein